MDKIEKQRYQGDLVSEATVENNMQERPNTTHKAESFPIPILYRNQHFTGKKKKKPIPILVFCSSSLIMLIYQTLPSLKAQVSVP